MNPFGQSDNSGRSQRRDNDSSDLQHCLREIRRFASWGKGQGESQFKDWVEKTLDRFPDSQPKINEVSAKGRKDRELLANVYNEARQQGRAHPNVEALVKLAENHGTPGPYIEKQLTAGDGAFQKKTQEERRKRGGQSLSNLREVAVGVCNMSFPQNRQSAAAAADYKAPANLKFHPCDIRGLSPGASWQIVIDETGDQFGPDAKHQQIKKQGRFVALLIPPIAALPGLAKGWHAVSEADEEIDWAVQAVLDAHIGVLGISVNSLPVTPGDRWMDGVATVLDWVLRLLPLGGHTKIDVLVENRGDFTAGQNWKFVERSCLMQLARSFPDRANKIEVSVTAISKDGSPYNGFVDAIAYTWAGTSETSRERLRKSGLLHKCLLEPDARSLRFAWDAFAAGTGLPAEEWWALAVQRTDRSDGSILDSLLTRVGESCRDDASVWKSFVQHCRNRLRAGAVGISQLAAAVDWLEEFHPPKEILPKTLKLVWLTVKLAKANHQGESELRELPDLKKLCNSLKEEEPLLVCHASLHVATAYTNRFDFDCASKVLNWWDKLPPIAPGLRLWAQMQSALGQCAAFKGNAAEAIRRFDVALKAFERLSDDDERNKDRLQTLCYKAIAMMDDAGYSDSKVRKAVEEVVGPLSESAAALAVDSSAEKRYMHHVLLRWLTHRPNPEATAAYISKRDEWEVGAGHPWPLTMMYRSLLLASCDLLAARELASSAAGLALVPEHGPVMHLIGACCRAVAESLGDPWLSAESDLQRIRQSLPLAGGRIDHLIASRKKPDIALELLRKVLPFNFR